MIKRNKFLDKEKVELIYSTIENFIMENHKLLNVKDILEELGISNNQFNKSIKFLEKNEKLVLIYGDKKGLPKLYIPKYMLDGILELQNKPKWLKNYNFPEKDDKLKKISELQNQIYNYEIIERLLYGTSKPLEESVAYCLDLVGLEDVIHHKDEDIEDVSFSFNGIKYLVEVKGKTKQADKSDITQLDSWLKRALNSGYKADEIEGILVINHYRKEDPADRPEPLTDKAKEFLKHYNFKFFTTKFLFEIVKNFLNNKIGEEIKDKIIDGEEIE